MKLFHCEDCHHHHKGALPVPNSLNFRKTSEVGGGVISDLKNYVANFSIKNGNFLGEKGGGHANPNEFRCKFSGLPKKAQHFFPKIGWGGVRGRLEVFRKFIKFGTGRRP